MFDIVCHLSIWGLSFVYLGLTLLLEEVSYM